MIDPKAIFGRLGNSMFQYAALYSFAKNMGVDFYFQDPSWFEDYKDEIRKLYSDDIPEPTDMAPVDMVGIHVRRASNPLNPMEPNYSENPFYVDLTKTDYYERAMALFPNDKFIVFSDDIEWCEEQDMFKGCKFSHNPEIVDMNRMASCKAQIIANSSFSWWASWLSPLYPHNRVIAPKNWYADGDNTRTKLPSHWEKI